MRLRNFGLLAAIALGGTAFITGASAESFVDFFFAPWNRPQPPQPQPQVRPYADPSAPIRWRVKRRSEHHKERSRSSSWSSASYCVRLCDGRYFPLQRNAGETVDTCNSFCPSARTKVFSGSSIDDAVADDGKRYTSLENAFAYRTKIVDGCTCNGKTTYGLARMDAATDKTLQSGDIVATRDGMVAYRTSRRGVAQFTPIDKSKVSSEMRSRLAKMRIQPEYNGEERTQAETVGVAPADEQHEKQTQR